LKTIEEQDQQSQTARAYGKPIHFLRVFNQESFWQQHEN
jgi:hypothetical protein